MITVANVVFEADLVKKRFACDTHRCLGACCTLPGGKGAPVEESEVAEFGQAFLAAKKYLSQEHVDAITRLGFFEGPPGKRTTTCIDDRDCAFSYIEDGIARCSFERAFLEGETSWRKPLSCHLFPLRAGRTTEVLLRYEQISECEPGRRKGETEGIPLVEFLQEPLVRKFGVDWYAEFSKTCQTIQQHPSGNRQ